MLGGEFPNGVSSFGSNGKLVPVLIYFQFWRHLTTGPKIEHLVPPISVANVCGSNIRKTFSRSIIPILTGVLAIESPTAER